MKKKPQNPEKKVVIEKSQIHTRVPPQTLKKLKLICAFLNVKQDVALIEAIELLTQKHKKALTID